MVRFIEEHREEYGVEPICAVLPIAPSTYYSHKAQEADPTLRSARAQRDEQLHGEVQRVWRDNFEVYGVRKVWRQLNREGHGVARCTVAPPAEYEEAFYRRQETQNLVPALMS